jgi:hypothetical protein
MRNKTIWLLFRLHMEKLLQETKSVAEYLKPAATPLFFCHGTPATRFFFSRHKTPTASSCLLIGVLGIYMRKIWDSKEFATSPDELSSQAIIMTCLVATEFILMTCLVANELILTHHQTDSTKTTIA